MREFRRFFWKASALNTLYNKLYLIWFRLRMAYTGKSNFTFPATRHFADIFSLIFFWQPKNYKSYSIVFKHLRKLWKCSCKFVFCRVWRVYAETRNTWIAGPRVALRSKGSKQGEMEIKQSGRRFINLKKILCIKKQNKTKIT